MAMPKDNKGREITGITSALPAKDAEKYGNKVRTADQDYYDILSDGTYKPETAAAPSTSTSTSSAEVAAKKKAPVTTAKRVENAPEPASAPASAPDEEQEEIETTASDEEQDNGAQEETTKDVEADANADADADADADAAASEEEVEISESEYDVLVKAGIEQVIARMVSHRKGKATLQSRIDKVSDIVGRDLIKAIEANEDLSAVKQIMHDIHDPVFQTYLGEFYETHERGAEGFKRVKGFAPTTDVFVKYNELMREKVDIQNAGVHPFMAEGEDFDGNDALARPNSPSGRALEKYNAKIRELDDKINILTKGATTTPQPTTKQDPEASKKAWDALIKKYPVLKDKGKMSEFQTFVRTSLSNPLEAFFHAFQANGSGAEKRRTLVLREIEAISRNTKSTPSNVAGVSTNKPAKSKKDAVPDNVNPVDWEKMKQDDDYFGDILK